ncbi:MAG: hypothetical protein IT391_03330 [Nitrospira sp.]|nr:hypothetical protein [Nitrospira sp.]
MQDLAPIAADARFTARLLTGLVRRVAKAEPAEADKLIAEANAERGG